MIHLFRFFYSNDMLKFTIKFFSLTFIGFFIFSSAVTSFLSAEEGVKEPVNKIEASKDTPPPPFIEDEATHELSYWKEFSRMMMILGAILGVVLLIAWLLRNFLNSRIKQVNQNNIIKVLERRNLSQKSMMYLIEVYNKQFLIGDSAAGGVEFLMTLDPQDKISPEEVDLPLKNSKFSFMEILQRKLTQKQSQTTPSKK